ncbi:MAG TPA: CPBP family intramembrane glutamic endopeptidase [Nitrospiraceae bacterium]|nr:CPBP family intramembrane glutamic endopeptidase [Nitrospiraceae bacterium]
MNLLHPSDSESSAFGESGTTPIPGDRFHFSPVATLLSALVLFGSVLFIVWLHVSVPPVNRIPSPERALARMVGRTMELKTAVSGAPAWEQWLYAMTIDTGENDLPLAIAWYEELAASSADPLVEFHLAVLEGEAGRSARIEEKSLAWTHRGDPFPFFARVVRAAYLEMPLPHAEESALQARLAEVLPAGWFYDRLAIRLAERAGDTALQAAADASLQTRAAPLLRRVRVLTAIELLLIIGGLIALWYVVKISRGGADSRFPVGAAPIPPPWPVRAGVEVLLRGGAFGVLIAMAFVFTNVDDPWIRLSVMPLAGLPLLIMAQRHLLIPASLGFAEGLGLTLVESGGRRLIVALAALVAAGLLGEWALSTLGTWLDLSTHWTEWFDPDLVWGETSVLIISLIEFVVFAPLLEELTFRGLLFGTLRRQFGPGLSIFLSAAVFAGAHGYGVLGFASVFWSGLLWAWMYEKTGSLLPGMSAHALNNLLVCMTLIWLLRT